MVLAYGKNSDFGAVRELNVSFLSSKYEMRLTDLDDGVKYYYRFSTFDAEGNEYKGDTYSLNTPARPRITNLRLQPVDGDPTSTQRITWVTNVPTTSFVRYSIRGGAAKEVSDSSLVTEHEVIVRGLLDDTDYMFTAESRDAGGNLVVSDPQALRTALDTRPPKISDVLVETSIRGTGAEARGQIIVSWKTDEPATSQIAYGEGASSTEFNNRTMEGATLATEHVVTVSDLPTSRIYNVLPVSRDASKNSSEAQAQSAIIGRASDSVITIVLNTLKKVFGF